MSKKKKIPCLSYHKGSQMPNEVHEVIYVYKQSICYECLFCRDMQQTHTLLILCLYDAQRETH